MFHGNNAVFHGNKSLFHGRWNIFPHDRVVFLDIGTRGCCRGRGVRHVRSSVCIACSGYDGTSNVISCENAPRRRGSFSEWRRTTHARGGSHGRGDVRFGSCDPGASCFATGHSRPWRRSGSDVWA
jgi:hypothetical protein